MPSPALDTHPEIQLLLRPLGFTLIPDPHLSSATAAAADTERKHGRRSSRVCSTGGDDDGPPLQVIMHHHQPAPLMAGPLVLVLLNTPTTQYVHPSSRPTNRCRSSPVVVVIIQNNHIVQIVIKPEEKTSNTAISRRLDRFSFFARVMFSFKPPITRPTERLLNASSRTNECHSSAGCQVKFSFLHFSQKKDEKPANSKESRSTPTLAQNLRSAGVHKRDKMEFGRNLDSAYRRKSRFIIPKGKQGQGNSTVAVGERSGGGEI
ncbi:hypothetical protein Fcan01_12455 [Folsomia candida]|uniref:Uncharacterized protein n=1 Tax=Folsomia candida TaxID=158441 RepID=A0A226E7A7_FOLCA|nr:hypothetical protein Fcan01_12455 [Folsomia candida]